MALRIRAHLFYAILAMMIAVESPRAVLASPLLNDPDGFAGISWGSPLGEESGLRLVETGERIRSYERQDEPLRLGEASVDSIRFATIDGKFARVTIRYHGQETHQAILSYLQSRFGSLEWVPGQMLRGLNQQAYWKGPETQISLTYEAQRERGYVFFESLTLAPLFNEGISETAY